MNNKTLKLILPICFILASFASFDLAKAEPVSLYRHAEYAKVEIRRFCPLAIGITCTQPTAKIVCSPFVSKFVFTSTGQVFLTPTDSITTPDAINWQGQHATKEEAVAATLASLESCLSANSFITPFTIPTSRINGKWTQTGGFGLYKANDCYQGGQIYKSWAYKDVNQIVGSYNSAGAYVYTGTARQVTYGNLDYYNSGIATQYRNWGWPTNTNQCLTGIYPEEVKLHTTICDGKTSISDCIVLDVSAPTSKSFTYEVDLKANGFDSLSVDPVSDITLSWTVSDPNIKNCIASGDWIGNKSLGGSQLERVNVAPDSIPAYSYYQGIVFGTPSSRSADCVSGTEGCSLKPHFYCSPWVNDSGVFIDKPSSATHINYQGNYKTAVEAADASNISLKNCLKSNNYGKATYSSPLSVGSPDYPYYIGTYQSGVYRGAHCVYANCGLNFACALGSWNISYGGEYWLYKGSLTSTGSGSYLDECKYNGVFEEIKYESSSSLSNQIRMLSSDCTPDIYGYRPRSNECSSINQQVSAINEIKVPEVVFNNAGSTKTYTLTCDYFGGKLSDSVVVTINDLSAPDAPRNVQIDTGIDNNRLPGNTVTWNAPAKTGSEIIAYEIVKYSTCVPKTKTDTEINSDVVSNGAKLFRLQPVPLVLEFKDSFVTSGSQYTYAVRTVNRGGGSGPFTVSECSSETPARQQLFTLTGSGFKDSMSISLVNDTTQDVLSCDPPNIPNDTTLTVECDITDFTPVGRWNIVVREDGVKTYESPANVFLSIIPKDNSLAPSDIGFSALNLSVANGMISFDSITGKNISESATVELVNSSDSTKRIPCITSLSQITSYNSDGLMTLTGGDGIKCPTNNLDVNDVNIEGTSDWRVIVRNSLATNGLESDLTSAPITSLTCNPVLNCTGKVCGSDQCGGLCKDTDGLDGTLTKSCTKNSAYGTCAATGIKTCVNGTYSECLPTSRDPRLDTCLGKECGDNKCGGQCGYGYNGCAGKDINTNGSQYTCNTTTSKCVCSSPIWSPDISNMCGLVRQTSTNCSPSITQLVNGGLTVPSGYKCVNNQLAIDTTQCTKTWVQYNKCVPNGWECGKVADLCGNLWSCNANTDGSCSNFFESCSDHKCD